MYTRLGENLTSLDEAEAVADHYVELVDQIVAAAIDGEVSVKPTQLGLDLDADACHQLLVRLAVRTAAAGSYLWLDMEGSAYTEPTIALYERLRAEHPRTGICLQAYLRRTAADIERLRPLDPAIRLVKGAYDEPETIAWRDRSAVDASFAALAVEFLIGLERTTDPARARDARCHADRARSASRSRQRGSGATRSRSRCCTGSGPAAVPAREGRLRVQTLIAYGDAWYPWYMRRLAERPANVAFAIRSMLP
jgi:proline dehydrogenase